VTFPRSLGQVPIYYSAKNTGRPYLAANPNEKYVSKYLDGPNTPLYPFGYGLGYADFTFSDIQLDTKTLHPGGKLQATLDVTNTGKVAGSETVQMYIHDFVADVGRPVLELKGFQRIALAPGQRQTVSFQIEEKTLAFLRADMTHGTEPGQYEVLIGPNSAALHTAKFDLSPH
jgi:beta-glucosidase